MVEDQDGSSSLNVTLEESRELLLQSVAPPIWVPGHDVMCSYASPQGFKIRNCLHERRLMAFGAYEVYLTSSEGSGSTADNIFFFFLS